MGDWADLFKQIIIGFFIMLVITVVIMGAGFWLGYNHGHDIGIKDCNNKTIAKQLGL